MSKDALLIIDTQVEIQKIQYSYERNGSLALIVRHYNQFSMVPLNSP